MFCLYSVVIFSFVLDFKADTKENEKSLCSIEWSSRTIALGKDVPWTPGRLEKIPGLQRS